MNGYVPVSLRVSYIRSKAPGEISAPNERLADYNTIFSIPDSNRPIMRPGDDVPPIGRVTNGIHPVPLDKLANCSTRIGIQAPNGVVPGSGDDVPSPVSVCPICRLPTAVSVSASRARTASTTGCTHGGPPQRSSRSHSSGACADHPRRLHPSR